MNMSWCSLPMLCLCSLSPQTGRRSDSKVQQVLEDPLEEMCLFTVRMLPGCSLTTAGLKQRERNCAVISTLEDIKTIQHQQLLLRCGRRASTAPLLRNQRASGTVSDTTEPPGTKESICNVTVRTVIRKLCYCTLLQT